MYLGLDLGTSELKALLLSEQHEVIATARSPLTVQRPQALWSEQNPADWWQALEAVMDQLLADIFGLALTVHQDSESGGAMGAARLAWLATGGDLDAVCVTPRCSSALSPTRGNPTMASKFAELKNDGLSAAE